VYSWILLPEQGILYLQDAKALPAYQG